MKAMPLLPFNALASAVEPGFLSRLGSTKAVKSDGEPILVYRGEHGQFDGLIQSRTPFSVAFGSECAALQYALEPNNATDVPVRPRILAAYLRIEKPAFHNVDDCFMDFTKLEEVLGRAAAVAITRKMVEHVYHTNNWEDGLAEEFESLDDLIERAPDRLSEVYFDAYPVFDDPECVQMFKDAGYDGAIHMGNAATFGELEYRIFDQSQIVPIGVACARTGELWRSFVPNLADRECEVEATTGCPAPV